MSWYDAVVLGITGVGLLNCLVFCISYWVLTRGHWWGDEAGRFLMLFFGCLGSVFIVVILNRILGNYPGRQIVITILYLALVIATGWPMRLLWQTRQEKRKTQE
jgi:hypothetical protein